MIIHQVVQITQQNQVAVLSGRIGKQSGGGDTSYELHTKHKVTFDGPSCPYAFTQKFVQIFRDASDNRYLLKTGYHKYKVQLSCSMEGPIIENMTLLK